MQSLLEAVLTITLTSLIRLLSLTLFPTSRLEMQETVVLFAKPTCLSVAFRRRWRRCRSTSISSINAFKATASSWYIDLLLFSLVHRVLDVPSHRGSRSTLTALQTAAYTKIWNELQNPRQVSCLITVICVKFFGLITGTIASFFFLLRHLYIRLIHSGEDRFQSLTESVKRVMAGDVGSSTLAPEVATDNI